MFCSGGEGSPLTLPYGKNGLVDGGTAEVDGNDDDEDCWVDMDVSWSDVRRDKLSSGELVGGAKSSSSSASVQGVLGSEERAGFITPRAFTTLDLDSLEVPSSLVPSDFRRSFGGDGVVERPGMDVRFSSTSAGVTGADTFFLVLARGLYPA